MEKRVPWNLILFLCLLLLILTSLCVGKFSVSPMESLEIIFNSLFGRNDINNQMAENVVLGLRLPRILASTFVGAALSISGAAYQGVFQNPLVSPDFLGVSSGACIGAATAILFSLSSFFTQFFSFLGGLFAVCLTLLLPKLLRSSSNIVLVISGIIVGGVMSSILGFLKYIADPQTELAAITYWQMGSFSYIDMVSLSAILPLFVIPGLFLCLISWWIDLLSLGEQEARILGADVKKIRTFVIVCATCLTAASVCVAGTIGWVGLIVPHFSRLLVGSNHRRLLPVSALAGACFLLLADTLTRTIGPAEMPISIVTGLVGAPCYAWLLYRQRIHLESR